MNRRLFALGTGLTVALTALPALAETLVFSEDWEGPTNTWATSKRCNALQGLNATDIGPSIAPILDSAACSGKILRDDNLFSGGYMYLRKKAAPVAPIPVAAGDKYCLSVWMRSPTTVAPDGGGFVIVSYTNSADGDLIGNALTGDHFVIGGFPDAQYGQTPTTTRDGMWHRYQKGWTVGATDLIASSDKMIVKTVNFNGAGCEAAPFTGPNNKTATPLKGPGIDFDDMRIYKLAAAEDLATMCPTGNETGVDPKLKPRADETPHEICKGGCAKTMMGAQAVFKCTPCDGAFGGGTANACPNATAPACVAGECKVCEGDNAVMGVTAACGAASPFCKTDGSCGKCTTDAQCADTAKNHGAGANKCDTAKGSCANGCTVATEATDCKNSTRPWCDVQPGATVGLCQEKQANGAPIPDREGDGAPDKGKCNDTNAAKFCASAKCDVVDNKCGLANGSACTTAEEALCRAERCGSDNKCASLEGGLCDTDANCREGGTCVANRCVKAPPMGASSGNAAPPPAGGDSGGCGCTTGSSSNNGAMFAGLAVAVTLFMRRRRNASR
jgi:MYXO-CTERM domain-containing protein